MSIPAILSDRNINGSELWLWAFLTTFPTFDALSFFLLEVGSIFSLSLLLGNLFKDGSFETRESLTSRSPQPPIYQGCLFLFFLLALRASVIFPLPIANQVSLFPYSSILLLFPSQVCTILPTCDFFLLSKWDWGVLTCALQVLDLFEFCGLYRVLRTFWLLISTCKWVHSMYILFSLNCLTQKFSNSAHLPANSGYAHVNRWVVSHCINEPPILFPFFYSGTSWLFPASGYHNQGCCELRGIHAPMQ